MALPSFGAWLARLGVIAVYLAGYGIAVSFHTVMSVVGSGSIANVVSVTPRRDQDDQAREGQITGPALNWPGCEQGSRTVVMRFG